MWLVVTAQMSAEPLSTAEDQSLNPIIGSFYWTFWHFLSTVELTKAKHKEVVNGLFSKKQLCLSKQNLILVWGRSPGLVVMGGDSCSKGREFESWHRILDGHFITYIFVIKFVMCV